MNRRRFITLVGGAAASVASWSIPGRAQDTRKILRVGTVTPFPGNFPLWIAFRERLRDLGYVEGQNFIFELIQIAGRFDDHAAIGEAMHELVRRKVDIIVDAGEEVTLKAAMMATDRLPIVMLAVTYDPVARGHVTSIARSTGNVTGLYLRRPELTAKQIGILTDAFPGQTRLAVLSDSHSADQVGLVEQIAKSLRLEVQSVQVQAVPYDFDAAFQRMVQNRAQILLVLSSSLFALHRPRIAELAMQHRLITMFTSKTYVRSGGLLSYGPDITAMFRRAAEYVDRLARGAKPADLPIEQPTRFELAVNIRTAKALDIAVPATLLALADEVIE